jgi:RNA polymerase sigma factor (sigma-70 family)
MNKNKFEAVLNSEKKKIFNYLLKILRNREDAEDILQEVFIAFYNKMETVDENYFTSYLYRAAHNKALNLIKSRKRKDDLNVHFEDMERMPEAPVETENPNNEKIRFAMRQLKEEQALILELKYFQKKSYKEIAEILETTESAVDSKLVRAKRKLKKFFLQENADKSV